MLHTLCLVWNPGFECSRTVNLINNYKKLIINSLIHFQTPKINNYSEVFS